MQIIYTVMQNFLPASGFKWIDPTEFDLNKHLVIVLHDVLRKLIENIQNNYTNYIMIIF